ncbi:hypothetical protein ACHWQZ_G009697 [Mnemiopsis leidyi]
MNEAEEPKAECPNKELNGVSAAIGNSGRLAVHHIVDGGANEKTPYQRQYRGDSTYGGTNDGEDHYSPVAVILFAFTGLIQLACIFCACLRKFSNNQSHTANNPAQTANNPAQTANYPAPTANYPAHTSNNPAHTANYPGQTANYPSHTANYPAHTANYPGQTANNPAQTENNPAHTANCPAYTANYPAHTANYPAHTAAPGFSSNVPSYIPGNVPPPSYDEVTASNTGGREPTSGGWFNKM